MTIDKAIAILKTNYEYATRQPHIRDPLAWALYQTWKVVDARGEKQ